MSFHPDLLGLLALAVALVSPARAEVKVGDPFPSPAAAGVANVSGGAVPSLDGHVVLVDFWASWCGPCKASFPALARLHADYASKGLLILAVGLADQYDHRPAALAFLKREAPPFTVVRDVGDRFVPSVAPPAMPSSYLVGRDGRVRYLHRGYRGPSTERELRQEIATLLAEKP